ncbi:serine-threonine rich protein, putative [Cordyceps militaris CM01]|uniref:Serine-threonine rich protein, putative n=1 Tax=Cordyceps militaris (strain CM01) TaxID=983644 RepID=G3J738_CORMM|nr:serine-threonine rich protein, putative [Cordyceps militaris CM01]EGX97111.1 serine-threonine rich protein, putative [Cordyceps militaris CM01]
MKWSTTMALAVAPLGTMAASNRLRSAHPVSLNPRAETESLLRGRSIAIINGMSGFGLNLNARNDIVIIWANPGNNAETTTINKPVTVTKTITAGAGEATAVPVAGGATTTIKEGKTATVPATGASHTVKVGGPGGLTFQPDQLNVPVGDSVVFEFLSQNHTVTQSPFKTPCKAMEGGMDSGFLANPNNTVSPPPQVAMQVMATTPLWFYCKQKGHCGKGMVFSINPTADKTQAMFQSLAIAQNGTGEATPITGGTGKPGAAPAAPAPPAAEAPKESAAPKEGGNAAEPPKESAAPKEGGSAAEPPKEGGSVEPPKEGGNATEPAKEGGNAIEPPKEPANAEQPKESPTTELTPLPSAGAESGAGGATPGKGTVGADGSCTCVVACNAGGFPAAAQGAGAFGGFAGSLPTNMAALR